MSKLLTLVPTRGLLFTKHQEALERELATIDQYPQVLRTEGIPIPDCRNVLVDAALQLKDWRFLLFLDDDVVLPEGAIGAMMHTLTNGSGNDIAVIDYPHHLHEYEKEQLGVGTYEYYKPGDDVRGKKLAWAGMGCVMMKRKAVEAMDKPLFKNSTYKYVRDESGQLKMEAESRQNLTGSAGEDVYFFFEARRQGMKVAVVPDMIAGHARVEQFIFRLSGGRHKSSHKIAINTTIDRPEI